MIGDCECATWCRAEPQPITDKHHQKCQRYNDMMQVVKLTHDGDTLVERSLDAVIELISESEDETYTLEFTQMLVREFEALPEFTGF